MVDRLKLLHRLMIVPALATVGFVAILISAVFVSWHNDALLERIELGYAPALELNRDLKELLPTIQRTLQNAATSADRELINEADTLRADFMDLVERGLENPTQDREILEQARSRFEDYHDVAREVTLRLIDDDAGENLAEDLTEMRKLYAETSTRLATATSKQRSEMLASFEDARRDQMASIGLMAVIISFVSAGMLLLSFLVARSLNRRVRAGVTFAEALARGDLSQRIDIDSNDEIATLLMSMNQVGDSLAEMASVAESIAAGELGRDVLPRSEDDRFGKAFQTMTLSLRDIIGRIAETSRAVGVSSEQISVTTRQMTSGAQSQVTATEDTSSVMVEIAAQIESISDSSNSIAQGGEQTTIAVEEMQANIVQMSDSASGLLEAADANKITIEEVITLISEVQKRAGSVSSISEETANIARERGSELLQVITGIGERSKEISRILVMIEEIADQTNLLALNAAIEAARAGDAGKGFSVVADEIRLLAERSIKSTREISDFVESVQQDTGDAIKLSESVLDQIVAAVEQTTEQAQKVYEVSKDQSASVEKIAGESSTVRNVAQRIADAAHEQSAGAEQIVRAATSMQDLTRTVAVATSEQKKGGDRIVRSMDEITTIATENLRAIVQLSETATGLSETVDGLNLLAEGFSFSEEKSTQPTGSSIGDE